MPEEQPLLLLMDRSTFTQIEQQRSIVSPEVLQMIKLTALTVKRGIANLQLEPPGMEWLECEVNGITHRNLKIDCGGKIVRPDSFIKFAFCGVAEKAILQRDKQYNQIQISAAGLVSFFRTEDEFPLVLGMDFITSPGNPNARFDITIFRSSMSFNEQMRRENEQGIPEIPSDVYVECMEIREGKIISVGQPYKQPNQHKFILAEAGAEGEPVEQISLLCEQIFSSLTKELARRFSSQGLTGTSDETSGITGTEEQGRNRGGDRIY